MMVNSSIVNSKFISVSSQMVPSVPIHTYALPTYQERERIPMLYTLIPMYMDC